MTYFNSLLFIKKCRSISRFVYFALSKPLQVQRSMDSTKKTSYKHKKLSSHFQDNKQTREQVPTPWRQARALHSEIISVTFLSLQIFPTFRTWPNTKFHYFGMNNEVAIQTSFLLATPANHSLLSFSTLLINSFPQLYSFYSSNTCFVLTYTHE